MRSRLLVLPAIASIDEFADVLCRVMFVFAYLNPDALTFVVADDIAEEADALNRDFVVPDELDPVLRRLHGDLGPRIEVKAGSDVSPATEILNADRIIVWNPSGLSESPWSSFLEGEARDRVFTSSESGSVFDVGWSAGARSLDDRRKHDLVKARGRFALLGAELGSRAPIHLLGPDASRDLVAKFDFFDAHVIVADDAVFDEALLASVRPALLVLSDPRRFLSPSAESAAFRAAVGEAVGHWGVRVVLSLEHAAQFTHLRPEVADRILGVPVGRLGRPNVDLATRFIVDDTADVLTSWLLPVAATLGSDLYLLGFDGREAGAAEKDDDYLRFLGSVDRCFLACELAGHRVVSLTDSTIPALARRRHDFVPDFSALTVDSGRRLVASINPDRIDEFGHHDQYDRAVRLATETRGWPMISLVSRGLREPTPGVEFPTFTHPTWVAEFGRAGVFLDSFRREFRDAAQRLLDRTDGEVWMMMYTAGLEHVTAVLSVVRDLDDPRLRCFLNLMRVHDPFVEGLAEREAAAVAAQVVREGAVLGGALGVYLFVDSEELREAVEMLAGVHLPLWPMFSVTDFGTARREPAARSRTPLRAYAPGTMQATKGFDLLTEMVRQMVATRPDEVRFALRLVRSPAGTEQRFVEAAEGLRSLGVEVIDGILDPDAYARHLAEADVVLIPYREHPFRSRTSAVFSDAILLGKPVVTTRSTWAGRQTEQHRVGTTFRDGDIADFSRAVQEMVVGYDRYRENAFALAEVWEADHSPDRLLDEFAAVASEPLADVPGLEARVAGLESLFRLAELGTVDATDRLGAAVRLLDERVMGITEDVNHLVATGDEQRLLLARKDDRLARKDDRLGRLESSVGDLRADIVKRQTRLNARNEDLAKMKREIGELRSALADSQRDKQHSSELAAVLRQRLALQDERVAGLERSLTNRLWRFLKTRFGRS